MASKNSISLSLFVEHFRQAWQGRRTISPYSQGYSKDGLPQLPSRLGLAVSGGADSMALAHLCQQLEVAHPALAGAISVTAFVVDHRARVESSDEAHLVAGWLSKMGINTKILELDWSPFSNNYNYAAKINKPAPMPSAFETHARRLRYQALGTACRDRGIEALLMGHHQDDSIETALWRLATGARLSGLGGIPQIARIPECHGLFGVSESGTSIRLLSRQNKAALDAHGEKAASAGPSSYIHTDSTLASGGIFLCRPLLGFPKARLLATCHESNIPYVSDPTNFDPTLTPRNAIRSMLASNTLPRALQAPRVLSLIRSSQDLLQVSTELSNQLLQSRCRVLEFNPKTGTMVVSILGFSGSGDPPLSAISAERIRQIQSLTLRRMTEMVSPFPGNHFPLRSFEPFTSRIFEKSHENGDERKAFTLGGVMFQPLDSNHSSVAEGERTLPPIENKIWMLSRQPFMKNRSPVTHVEIPMPTSRLNHPNKLLAPSVSPWILWDDRYWFRLSLTLSKEHPIESTKLKDIKAIPFIIRPFEQSDLQKIRKGLESGLRQPALAALLPRIRKLLSVEAPGSTRFTIPVLIRGGMGEGGELVENEASQFLALPSLGFPLSISSQGAFKANEVEIYYEGRLWKFEWEWMYKMVDTEALRLMDGPIEVEADIVHNKF
ncbi:uncharacterized protein N7459_003099 [Penicillium hispanicum]|uniref:uncharacterized protein n=1 Tax=Penicillium hispanicum TaxID=1080232 RepID=UPI0025413DF3|nr:uncharacterized protein N7459_003099 [Penicillium hispanicum]KAJ5587334.1 hypothetical protein N7459_003099 [Penicillium hispanicum]